MDLEGEKEPIKYLAQLQHKFEVIPPQNGHLLTPAPPGFIFTWQKANCL